MDILNGSDRTPMQREPVGRFLFRTFIQFFVFPALASACALLLVYHFVVKPGTDLGKDRLAWIVDASNLIAERYVEPIDSDRLAWEAIKGMTASLDPYSDFVSPDDFEKYREEAEGQYVGIGFVLYAAGDPVTVLYPFPGSPAAKAGLMPGDRIVAVDGEDCAGKKSDEIVKKIKNLPGTPVKLRVRPYGSKDATAERELVVVRELIDTPSVFDPRIVDTKSGVGYVRVADFHEHTTEELVAAMLALDAQGMKSLVLDLRHNRGGLLTQAIQVTSLFLDDAVVVRTEGRTEDNNVTYKTEQLMRDGKRLGWFDLPLSVLVDAGSASASEIVSGALQDHLRATLVGERTFGKGMVQTQIQRPYGTEADHKVAVLKITTSRYLTPSGRLIEARFGFGNERRRGGLVPDVPILLEDEQEARDFEQYQKDREIADSTWALIRERCPKVTQVQDGKFRDRQLERAIDVLNGVPAFQKVY